MKSYDGTKLGHARSRHTVSRRIAASTPYAAARATQHSPALVGTHPRLPAATTAVMVAVAVVETRRWTSKRG